MGSKSSQWGWLSNWHQVLEDPRNPRRSKKIHENLFGVPTWRVRDEVGKFYNNSSKAYPNGIKLLLGSSQDFFWVVVISPTDKWDILGLYRPDGSNGIKSCPDVLGWNFERAIFWSKSMGLVISPTHKWDKLDRIIPRMSGWKEFFGING